jgi:hypothetical protein
MKKHVSTEESRTDYALGFQAGILYARTVEIINAIVDENGGQVSGSELARGLGTLLLSKASGSALRPADHLHQVRGATAQGNQTLESPAVDKRSQGRSSRYVTDEERREIKRLYAEGMRPYAIGRQLGRSDGLVSRVLKSRPPMSEDARMRIGNAQRARWAKQKRSQRKRKLSPAQLRTMRENAVKARAARLANLKKQPRSVAA